MTAPVTRMHIQKTSLQAAPGDHQIWPEHCRKALMPYQAALMQSSKVILLWNR